jgi:hypothetical protein
MSFTVPEIEAEIGDIFVSGGCAARGGAKIYEGLRLQRHPRNIITTTTTNDNSLFSLTTPPPPPRGQRPDRAGPQARNLLRMADTAPPMAHEDSIESQDPNLHGEETKRKSRRPASEDSFDGERIERILC